MITTKELLELKELAGKAIEAAKGPFDRPEASFPIRQFHGRANPEKVLQLIAMLERAKEVIEFYAGYESQSYKMDTVIYNKQEIIRCTAYEIGKRAREFLKELE